MAGSEQSDQIDGILSIYSIKLRPVDALQKNQKIFCCLFQQLIAMDLQSKLSFDFRYCQYILFIKENMFLFSCCREADSTNVYAVKKQNGQGKKDVEFFDSINHLESKAIQNNNIIIQKIQKSPYRDLINKFKNGTSKWTDLQFPPSPQSLGDIQNVGTTNWKRISDILNKPALFQGSVRPQDVIQGNLGDCYFLSALAALAQKQSRIKAVFDDQEYNENGIYKVTLRIDGIIQQILVDDYIPVNNQQQPLFCQPNKNQFWVLILEKAWAKAHGSYANIAAGNPTEVFKAVTFAPAQLVIVKQSQQQRLKLWRTIVIRAANDNPCCCGTDDRQQQNWEKKNLIPGHAYTLIHAASLIDKDNIQHKMLLLRNPWGKTEWEGQGSEDDKQFWSRIPNSPNREIFDKYRRSANDGIFFMTYKDFCQYFSQVHFCLLEERANYIYENIYCDKKHASLYNVKIHKKGTYMFQLHQSGIRGEDPRKIEDGLSRSTLLLAQSIEQTYKFVDASMKYNDEDLNLHADLTPGNYILYAKLDPTRKYGQVPQKSSVSVYSVEYTSLVLLDQKNMPNFLHQVFSNYAKLHKRQSYNNDQMWISWKLMFLQGGFAFIGFGNNRDSNRKFIINFDESEFQSLNFKLKKPFKGKGNKQTLQILPGEQKLILARVNNVAVKTLKFPPQLGIKMEKLEMS